MLPLEKIEEVKSLNRKSGNGPHLLAGAHVDILQDGTLDYPEELSRELDIVIGAIHSWKKGEDLTRGP